MSVTAAQRQLDQVKQLHRAVDAGDASSVRTIVSGPGASELCEYELQPYSTALHHAAGLGDTDIIGLILDAGLDVNIRQLASSVSTGQTPCHIAALAGRSEAVKLLLSRGANVNAQESEGQTPLHCACSGNDLTTLQILVQNGAAVNIADHRKETPLQRSILRSSTEISLYLIENGADLSVCDADGQSVLHYAVQWENKRLVEVLLGKGLDTNLQDNDGCSPLHLAGDNDEIMDILVKHGGDLNLRDHCGRPPISTRIDVAKEEYQRINAVLERHLSFELPDTILPSKERVQDVQERFNKMAVHDEEGVTEARQGIMEEILRTSPARAPKHHVASPLAASGVLDQIRQPPQE